MYAPRHERRPTDYDAQDYFDEFGVVVNGIHDDKKITRTGNLVAPSLQGTWSPEDLWSTGYLDAYGSSINILAMEQYVADRHLLTYLVHTV